MRFCPFKIIGDWEWSVGRAALLPLQRHDALDVHPPPGLVQVVIALKVHPILGGIAKEAAETHGHVGGHGDLALHEVHQRSAGNFDTGRERGSAHVEGIEVEILE